MMLAWSSVLSADRGNAILKKVFLPEQKRTKRKLVFRNRKEQKGKWCHRGDYPGMVPYTYIVRRYRSLARAVLLAIVCIILYHNSLDFNPHHTWSTT
jgi:hypothetical protein